MPAARTQASWRGRRQRGLPAAMRSRPGISLAVEATADCRQGGKMGHTMYKHFLIATDGSELAQKAVRQGLELAKRLGAKVTALTVSEPWPVAVADGVVVSNPIDDYERAMAQEASRHLAGVSELARDLG